MFLVSLYRSAKLALQNFFRNFWLSLVTITIFVLALASVTTLMGLTAASDALLETVNEKVDIALYFKPSISDELVLLTSERIQDFPRVQQTEIISAEDALAFFKEQHRSDPLINDALAELDTNPLGSVLLVQAQDIASYDRVLAQIESLDLDEIVEDVDYQDRRVLIGKLDSITEKTTLAMTIMSAFFLIVAILVVFNTIRLGMYSHREEIAIMKLVGASNWFTRTPFLIEGFLYALLSTAVFWALFLGVLTWLNPLIQGFFSEIAFSPRAYFLDNLWLLVIQQVIGLTVLTVLSAYIATRRYLRV